MTKRWWGLWGFLILAPALAAAQPDATPGAAPVPVLLAQAASPPAPGAASPPYRVQEGYKVDANTFEGFRAWRAAGCDRCHGANQQGLVGPSLIDSLKVLSKADFTKVVLEGRLDKGMPSFSSSKTVVDNIDHLYAYLKGRSDGAITRSRVERMP